MEVTGANRARPLGTRALPRYEVIRQLGEGSCAYTLLVRDLRLGRHVALKVLHPRAAKSLFAGKDPQPERAGAEWMKQLQGKTVKLPPMPAGPVKVPRP